MSFKLNNHPNKSNSGLTFSEQKQNETLRKQQEAIQRLKDRKDQPGLFENLDNVQTTLEGVGMTAGPQSIAADIANTAVSLGRGVYSFGKGDTESGKEHITMAGLHGLSSIPLLGKIAEGFKLGRRAKNVAKNINKTETPNPKIETPHYGNLSDEKVKDVIGSVTAKGRNFDAYKGPLRPEYVKRMPTVSGREQVLVDIPNVGKQVFYKSTSLGQKIDKYGTGTKDRWIPLPGYGTSPWGTKDWFIKSKGYDTGYGSKFFEQLYDQPEVLSNLLKK